MDGSKKSFQVNGERIRVGCEDSTLDWCYFRILLHRLGKMLFS